MKISSLKLKSLLIKGRKALYKGFVTPKKTDYILHAELKCFKNYENNKNSI